MNIENYEYESSDGILYTDENISIEFSINQNQDLIYFKIFKDTYSSNCVRISMTEPKYLESNLKLTKDELCLAIDIVSSKWDELISMINSERINSYDMNPINISIPDYSILKETYYE